MGAFGLQVWLHFITVLPIYMHVLEVQYIVQTDHVNVHTMQQLLNVYCFRSVKNVLLF